MFVATFPYARTLEARWQQYMDTRVLYASDYSPRGSESVTTLVSTIAKNRKEGGAEEEDITTTVFFSFAAPEKRRTMLLWQRRPRL